MSRKPGILVLCTGNSCRGQMAEAFLRKHAGDRYEVYSAGTQPAESIHPLTYAVMAEVGLDLAGQRPKPMSEYLGRVLVQTLISVCEEAARSCPAVWPGVRERLRWPFDDPAAFTGGEAERLAEFRRVRDAIEARVRSWAGERAGAQATV
jgi:arsenate reductase (thioredoxin)